MGRFWVAEVPGSNRHGLDPLLRSPQRSSQPLQLPMTAMPPRWKRSRCTLTQLLFGLLCSLATLLVLSFLASIRPEDPLLSQMGSGVGEQFIDTLLQPSPNAFPLSPSPCALTTPWLLWGCLGTWHSRQHWSVGEHGDLLQAPFADTYTNLTLKTLAMLGWATTRCPTARFLLKANDDMFLNLPALVRHLQQLAGPPAAYLGYVYSHVAPIHNPHSRHYVPTLLYPEPAFPPYCVGSAYILSAPAAAAVLGAARLLPMLPVEDVFVGLCTHHAGIAPRHLNHMAGATHYPPDACCYREVLLSVHEVEPAEMLRGEGQDGTYLSMVSWMS
ncbi:hypothetical protein E2320_022448 [Naja naja]|nr:hypothetical protein E2320_022448 [Naja naja]